MTQPLTRQQAVDQAFSHVARQTGVEVNDGQKLACLRSLGEYESVTHHYVVSRDHVDSNAAIIRYRSLGCVNDGYATYVFVDEDGRMTFEN